MEVVAAAPGPTGGAVSPFRDHDVREWSRIDTITGALERARIETDSWTASTNDGCHKYGKVLDSRARTGLNGSLHQQASRQLEVFQSNGPGARLQVIKTHTVSSSRWSGKLNGPSDIIGDFEGLQLTVNPLDVTSQKAKASVARSAIRRPPTRQRPQNLSRSPPIDLNHQFKDPHFTAAANLHRVSRLCHQIHETAVRQAFGRTSADTDVASSERGSGDGNASGVEIVEIESVTPSSGDVSDRSSLTRTKSISSEDLHVSEKVSNTNKLEDIQSWKRSSKIRRSLPSSIQNNNSAAAKIDFPQSVVSVKKIREELEKDKNLSTALTGNAANLTSFDQITQIASISNSDDNGAEDTVEDQEVHPKPKQKKDSFVTVESIQEIKNRLKSTDSPTSMSTKKEDVDDGIDTEDHRDEESQSSHNRVKSYVFGMEAKLQKKKPLISTGSLESKSKMANGNANHRNEDWYNRRKSYGFEQVHNEDESNSFKTRSRVESSTDSGICRSSDIDHPAKQANGKYDSSSDNDVEKQSTSNDDKIGSGISYGNVRKMTSIFNQGNFDATTSPASSWTKTLFTDWKSTDNKSTVTVPVVRSNLNELSWNNDPDKEVKRHSIAVDDVKFTAKSAEGKFRRSSLVSADHYPKCENLDDENVGNNRKPKKVEFCKTEIHFAADTGKVNIVETDEKPPPTHNFRRRRRNSGTNFNPDFNKNGLPVLHFGDSTDEKSMFGVNYRDSPDHFATYENLQPRVPPLPEVVDIATDVDSFVDYSEVEKKELENLKGILKNKPVKPKPYHLGDIPFSNSDEETQPWGSQLRVANVEPPKWRSVVTVQNSYDGVPDETNQQTEFQKLLRNLRPTKLPSYAADSDNQNLNRFANVRTIPVAIDHDVSASESRNEKIYSTRINIENSQANAQENRNEINNDLAKVPKQIVNKGLIVRVGRENSVSKHTVRTKTTTEDNDDKTTTTKITIDLTPSPQNQVPAAFTYAKYRRSQNDSFKSTPLVLSTLKYQKEVNDEIAQQFKSNVIKVNGRSDEVPFRLNSSNRVPEQLEALKKLYEDIPSDSDADKEVQRLMSRIEEREVSKMEENGCKSVVSGSWSKMRTRRECSDDKSVNREIKSTVGLEKSSTRKVNRLQSQSPHSRRTEFSNLLSNKRSPSPRRRVYSPITARKPALTSVSFLKPSCTVDHLSSSSLVGRSVTSKHENSTNKTSGRRSPTKDFKNADNKLERIHTNENIVLRQPKQSEMTYFGVKVNTKSSNEASTSSKSKVLEKPDLIRHYNKSPPALPARIRRVNQKPGSPIYENLRTNPKKAKGKYSASREFDSSILDELTKAADQILQVVNGYTNEDGPNRLSSDEEVKPPLDTISETKSWRSNPQPLQSRATKPTLASAAKVRVRRTSSTSSVESLSKERSKQTRENQVKVAQDPSVKKKASSDSSSVKASTKARRLQRACSREALLQSHGSSSEDLPAKSEAPVRKPRLIKKTKASQFTISNGLELKKPIRKKDAIGGIDERVIGVLPEIKRKTGMSSIRSTSESGSRDRLRHKVEDSKLRNHPRDDANRETSRDVIEQRY
ncbi:uncharacterized protein LOC132702829 isoform X2 [Cylas formicarius]|uniref:uncharacterized protein LOC132702829 isoform X2 n=1 Tax=Cylas formicarius TaxID=197179 RepID=UPI00295860D0|nr:uncharacterized protein LOC132702829 isoform X2 [Cylas formicarius]